MQSLIEKGAILRLNLTVFTLDIINSFINRPCPRRFRFQIIYLFIYFNIADFLSDLLIKFLQFLIFFCFVEFLIITDADNAHADHEDDQFLKR